MSFRLMRACAVSAAAAPLLFLGPDIAQAHEADNDHTHGKAVRPDVDPERHRSNRIGAFELRAGPYRPRVDNEFNGATPYTDAFGDKPGFTFGVEADWQVLRIPHFGSLGPGLGVHYTWRGGTAAYVGAPEPGNNQESAHRQLLWMIPTYAVAVLRIDVFKREFGIPLVPYAKGGLAVGIWEARDARKVSTVNGEKGRGIETGLQFQLGGMLHLNPLAPQAAIDLDNSSGVNDAYLFIEWWRSDLNSFGRGLQMGTSTWIAGLTVEY